MDVFEEVKNRSDEQHYERFVELGKGAIVKFSGLMSTVTMVKGRMRLMKDTERKSRREGCA